MDSDNNPFLNNLRLPAAMPPAILYGLVSLHIISLNHALVQRPRPSL